MHMDLLVTLIMPLSSYVVLHDMPGTKVVFPERLTDMHFWPPSTLNSTSSGTSASCIFLLSF